MHHDCWSTSLARQIPLCVIFPNLIVWTGNSHLLHDMSIISVQMTIQRTDLPLSLLDLPIFITSHSWVGKSHYTIPRICLLKTHSLSSLHRDYTQNTNTGEIIFQKQGQQMLFECNLKQQNLF